MITISKEHYNKILDHAFDQSQVNAWIKLHERTNEQLNEARQEILRLMEQLNISDIKERGTYIELSKYNDLSIEYLGLRNKCNTLSSKYNELEKKYYSL